MIMIMIMIMTMTMTITITIIIINNYKCKIWQCGGLVVAKVPRSLVQTPAKTEIWIEIYVTCELLHVDHNIRRQN